MESVDIFSLYALIYTFGIISTLWLFLNISKLLRNSKLFVTLLFAISNFMLASFLHLITFITEQSIRPIFQTISTSLLVVSVLYMAFFFRDIYQQLGVVKNDTV